MTCYAEKLLSGLAVRCSGLMNCRTICLKLNRLYAVAGMGQPRNGRISFFGPLQRAQKALNKWRIH